MLQPSGPVQSTYTRYSVMGQVGTPASETGWDADTKIFEEHASPAAGIGFGLAVNQSTVAGFDRGIRLGGTTNFVGITMTNKTQNVSEFTDKYAGGDNVPVMVRGDIFVVAEAPVVAGEAAYYNPATGVLGHSGGTLVPGGRWMTSTTGSNQIAVLRLGSASNA